MSSDTRRRMSRMIEGLSPRRKRIATHLQRTVSLMSLAQLRAECVNQGHDALLQKGSLVNKDRSSLCEALLNELLAP